MSRTLPPSNLPLLPLRRGVVLPGGLTPLPLGRARSIAVYEAVEPGDQIVLAVQYDGDVTDPAIADLHPVALVADVKDKRSQGRRGQLLIVEPHTRVHLDNLHHGTAFSRVDVTPAEETGVDTDEAHALADSLRSAVLDVIDEKILRQGLTQTSEPGLLADRVASVIDLQSRAKAEVLRSLDVEARLRLVVRLFGEAKARVELKEKIDSEVRKTLSDNQREAVLREQLRAIRKELDGGEGGDDEADRLRQRLEEADLPEEVRKTVDRELRRLEASQGQGAEANVIRTYLELIADLPWTARAEATQEIDGLAAILDRDHFGLDDVKRRILEQMAVLKLSAKAKGTIVALVGPPGVGKTSLAQSVADATGRPLARVALGGVRDEAEIRGHRRTYVGALPGRILNAIRKAGVKNPVIVLDELDKLGRGWAGDPEAALLEVLDPEQNHTFTDHYLELPFDLSEVLFIATANEISQLSAPLRDRLEVIEVTGYTTAEKVAIGQRHLWPKKKADHGLDEVEAELDDEAMGLVIRDYTREAGVRQLQRELAKVCRALALDVARGRAPRPLDGPAISAILGRPRFFHDEAELNRPAGVAAGLAWTPVGGDVLYVETTKMPGQGKVEITGQLGEVMNESARAALAYLRSHAHELDIAPRFLDEIDLHIHVPAGAVPKDGPSAGVTMLTALASLLTGRAVKTEIAMTGEASLRGRVLPVGGIKSKVLAAHRAGFSTVILPAKNERDLDEIPDAVREELTIILAEDMADVLEVALTGDDTAETERPARAPSPARAYGSP